MFSIELHFSPYQTPKKMRKTFFTETNEASMLDEHSS